jgi:hypothetical protein
MALEKTLTENNLSTSLWHEVKSTLEELQARSSKDVKHLTNCQRAMSKKNFTLTGQVHPEVSGASGSPTGLRGSPVC